MEYTGDRSAESGTNRFSDFSARGPSPLQMSSTHDDYRNLEFAAGNLEIYWKCRNVKFRICNRMRGCFCINFIH